MDRILFYRKTYSCRFGSKIIYDYTLTSIPLATFETNWRSRCTKRLCRQDGHTRPDLDASPASSWNAVYADVRRGSLLLRFVCNQLFIIPPHAARRAMAAVVGFSR